MEKDIIEWEEVFPEQAVSEKALEVLNPVVGYVISKYEEWKAARSGMEANWEKFYRTWRCIEDESDKERETERSKIKIPATKEAVSIGVDAVFSIEFGSSTWFKVEPECPNQENYQVQAKSAYVLEQFMRYLLRREGFRNKAYQALTDMAIYGTTVSRVVVKPYKFKEKKVQQVPTTSIDPISGVPVQTMIEQSIEVERVILLPETQYIPIYNFYVDPYATGIQANQGCDGVIVVSMQKIFEYPELAEELKRAENQAGKEYRLSLSGINAQPSSSDVEIIEFWGWLPSEVLKDSGLEYPTAEGGAECVVKIANKRTLISLELNPLISKLRPFVKDCWEEIPGQFYGMGIVESAQGPQRALDASVRSRMDNSALSINNMFAINTDKFVPGQTLKTYPGRVFLFNGNPAEALMPLNIPYVCGPTFQDAAEYERYIQSAHGISRIVGGLPAKRGEQTATEISMMMNQSSGKIQVIASSFEDNFLGPILDLYAQVLGQFAKINAPFMFQVTNEMTGVMEFASISQDDIANKVRFVLLGAIALNARQEFNKRLQALQLVSNPILAPFANIQYLLKKTYEAMNLNDTDLAIITNPPPNQVIPNIQQGSPPAIRPESTQENNLMAAGLLGGMPSG